MYVIESRFLSYGVHVATHHNYTTPRTALIQPDHILWFNSRREFRDFNRIIACGGVGATLPAVTTVMHLLAFRYLEIIFVI